jgi:2,4-dienoyl-CoA reductase-like NADH-dependent reductase (Old Yellow Enzyme family)
MEDLVAMPVPDLFQPLALAHGAALKNRFMLAPLTTQQSRPDGTVSEDELAWLRRCAAGGFGLVMTCAAHVQAIGQAFPGQLGIWDERHLPGLTRVAAAIGAGGARSSVQLHHGGSRARAHGLGTPVGPSDDPAGGARRLSLDEVEALRDDFVRSARRAERAGFDGVEVHAAFGWIITQFLSPTLNRRTDRYGGDLAGRSRLLFEIIDAIRASCRPDFQIGLRLSVERYGLVLGEIRAVAARAMREERIDYLDLAPWDVAKPAGDPAFPGRTLLGVFTDLPRGRVRLGASGKIMTAAQAAGVLEAGCDFAMIGRAAILRHDFPELVRADPAYRSPALPVTVDYLRGQGLSPAFIGYMRNWDDFLAG